MKSYFEDLMDLNKNYYINQFEFMKAHPVGTAVTMLAAIAIPTAIVVGVSAKAIKADKKADEEFENKRQASHEAFRKEYDAMRAKYVKMH